LRNVSNLTSLFYQTACLCEEMTPQRSLKACTASEAKR
jgi:hypothetical protein